MRVQAMLLPFEDQYQDRWSEDGDATYLVVRVPQDRVTSVVHRVSACHPSVEHVHRVDLVGGLDQVGSAPTSFRPATG